MTKKIIKIGAVVAAVIIAIGCVVWINVKEVPVLNKPFNEGETILLEDIAYKYEFNPSNDYVLEESEMIGKSVTIYVEANSLVPKFILGESKGETPKDEPVEEDKNVTISLSLSDMQMPEGLKAGDKVYISTFYEQGAIENQPSYNIVYPTIATVSGVRSSVVEGVGSTVVGIDLEIEKEYSSSVLYGNIAGKTFLLKTSDSAPTNLSGNTAQKEFITYYSLNSNTESIPELNPESTPEISTDENTGI